MLELDPNRRRPRANRLDGRHEPATDPEAAAALQAHGFASRLTLPISHGGEVVGHLEVYAHDQRPWSRFQVGRARLICYLGPLLRAEHATTPR
jgi:GAF domain-containing protein